MREITAKQSWGNTVSVMASYVWMKPQTLYTYFKNTFKNHFHSPPTPGKYKVASRVQWGAFVTAPKQSTCKEHVHYFIRFYTYRKQPKDKRRCTKLASTSSTVVQGQHSAFSFSTVPGKTEAAPQSNTHFHCVLKVQFMNRWKTVVMAVTIIINIIGQTKVSRCILVCVHFPSFC